MGDRGRRGARVMRALVAVCAATGALGASSAAAGTTERVSVHSGGDQRNEDSGQSAISADGRYVAFVSGLDVFVRDRLTGTTEPVSVDRAGHPGNGVSSTPSISADGRYVAFVSAASNLVAGDTNLTEDVFVHDRATGATERVSVDSAGHQGNDFSGGPAVSADGRYVAF